MAKKENVIKQLHNFKEVLSRKMPVEKMILFGSTVTKKTHKYSDIDLIIVSSKFKNIKFRHRSLGFYKYWKLKYPVDFLCYTPAEFKKMSKQITIVGQAVKEGIEIN